MPGTSILRCGGGLILAGTLAMTGCAGDDGGNAASTPSPPPASPTNPTQTPTATRSKPAAEKPGIKGARAALQTFLRSQATGTTSACRYVARGSAFENGPALRGSCPEGIRNARHLLRPSERRALTKVTVSGGRATGSQAVIPFSGLRWTDGNLSAATLQPTFTLRRSGGVWRIVR